MASTLAQQLASVAGARKAGASQPAAGGSRKKPSLLFDQQKAADVDAHTLYLIGCEGLEALCKLEPRFTGFRSSLFSQASVNFVRDQQTVETLENLEGVLSHFFDCLTEHFLSPGCFKALEYLIRKYRINEYNVHALLSMALPYHSTHEFVRLVQTLSLFNSQASQSIKSCWGWLSRMQESGASLPRDVLVQRCINDKAVFRALCEGAKRMGNKRMEDKRMEDKRASSGASSPTYLSFYAVVICEMVAFPGALNEEVLERLLPYLVEGLEPTSSVDYRAASLMIFAEVCARVSLSQPFLTAILTSMVLGMEAGSNEHVRTVLLVLSHAASTQPHLEKIPALALQGLLGCPLLMDELSHLSRAKTRIDPLISLLCEGLLEIMTDQSHSLDPSSSYKLLQSIVHEGLVVARTAQQLTSAILNSADVPEPERSAGERKKSSKPSPATPQLQSWLIKLLRTLERRAPEAVDAGINTFLGATRMTGGKLKNPHAMDESDEEEEEKATGSLGLSPARLALIYKFVVEAFAGTAHAPCGDSGMTVEAASRAPQAGLRMAAMVHAGELIHQAPPPSSDPTELAEARARLGHCLVMGLGDDDWSVVQSALEVQGLDGTVPAPVLLPALEGLMKRAFKALVAPKGAGESSEELSGSIVALGRLVAILASLQDDGRHDPVTVERSRDMSVMLVLALVVAPARALSAVGELASASRTQSLFPCKGSPLSQALRQIAELDCEDLLKPFPSNLPKTDRKAWKEQMREKRVEALVVFRRSLVHAVASSLSSPAALTEVLRLLGRCQSASDPGSSSRSWFETAALHALVLALHTRLVEPQPEVQPPSSSLLKGNGAKKAGGKKTIETQQPNSSTSETGPQDLTVALLQLCFSEIELLRHQNGAGLFDDWIEQSSLFLGSSNQLKAVTPRPTTEHVQQAHTSLVKVHAAALCLALHSALVAHFTAMADQPPHLLARAARRQFDQVSALPAPFHYHHLDSFLEVAFKQVTSRCTFLGQVYASNSPPLAKIAALRLHAKIIKDLPSPPLVLNECASWLGYALSAASSPDTSVRKEAVSLLTTLGSCPLGHLSAACAALASQGSLLLSDADAARTLISRSISSSRQEEGLAAAPTPSKSAKGKGKPSSDPKPTPLFPTDLDSLLLSSLPRPQPHLALSSADMDAVRILLACLLDEQGSSSWSRPSSPPLKNACLVLLASFSSSPSADVDDLNTTSSDHLAKLIVQVLSSPLDDESSKALCELLDPTNLSVGLQAVSSWHAPYRASLRRAAFGLVSASTGLLSSLMTYSPDSSVLVSLVMASSSDPCERCRKFATAALESVDMNGALVKPLILKGLSRASKNLQEPSAPPPAKKKKATTLASDPPASVSFKEVDEELDIAGLNLSIHVLELLQWKKLVGGLDLVVSAAQTLLDSLLPLVGSISVPHDEKDEEEDSLSESQDAATRATQSSLVGYASQLALTAIESAATAAVSIGKGEAEAVIEVLRPEVVVKAAQGAPDSAIRNSALSLLAVEARLTPDSVLSHVLQVLSVIHHSVVVQEDQYSRQVASAAMQALVPAWLGAGRPPQEMWQVVVNALPQVAGPRRLSLLSSLLAAMPKVGL